MNARTPFSPSSHVDTETRNGLRRAAMVRSGAGVGVILLMLAVAQSSLSSRTAPAAGVAPTSNATATPATRSPEESSAGFRDAEQAEWIQGTQG